MNLENLREKYPDLIVWMNNEGYHSNYVYHVEREIKRILKNAEKEGWKSYSDVYQEYTIRLNSAHTLKNKRTFLGLIEHFDTYGLYPDSCRRQKIVQRAKYYMLTDEFKAVIDYYREHEKKREKKDSTIHNEASHAASFLYTLQEQGFKTLDTITEYAVLSVFIGEDGNLRRSCSYKKDVTAVFKACMTYKPEPINRILSYLPKLRESRKNIQYLQPEEIAMLKQTLVDANSPLSLRDKAIGMMILKTGLRCCDIAGMTLSSIDWDSERIYIKQQKTEAPLELPFTAIIGNAIYDYLSQERPKTESDHIFVSVHRPYQRLKSGSLVNVASKLLAAANIRQMDGDRRGFHIFRHHLATALLGNGVSRPVISQILGHDSPDSLETYLSADFVHLKECALSIERFPVDEVVFANA